MLDHPPVCFAICPRVTISAAKCLTDCLFLFERCAPIWSCNKNWLGVHTHTAFLWLHPPHLLFTASFMSIKHLHSHSEKWGVSLFPLQLLCSNSKETKKRQWRRGVCVCENLFQNINNPSMFHIKVPQEDVLGLLLHLYSTHPPEEA